MQSNIILHDGDQPNGNGSSNGGNGAGNGAGKSAAVRLSTHVTHGPRAIRGSRNPSPGSPIPVNSQTQSLLARSAEREPKGLVKLVENIEKDYQFKLGYLVIAAMVESAEVSISVDDCGCSDKAVAAANERLAQVLADNLTAKWSSAVPHAMRAFAYGRQAFERAYRIDPKTELALLDALDPLPFERTRMLLGDDGHYLGVEVTGKGDTVVLDSASTWWFGLDATAACPHGRSRYLGAPFEVYKRRRLLDDREDVFDSKFSLGISVGHAPSAPLQHPIAGKGEIAERDENGQPIDPMDQLTKAYLMAEAGGIICLPSDQYTSEQGGGKMYELDQIQLKPDASPLENRRRVLDAAALRSIGVPERAVTQDAETGSLAMAQAHLAVLNHTVEGVLKQIAESYQHVVIDEAVKINFPASSRPTLTIAYKLPDAETRELVLQLVSGLFAGPVVSPLITHEVVPIDKLLEVSGLPVGDGVAEKLAAIKAEAEKLAAAGMGVGVGGAGGNIGSDIVSSPRLPAGATPASPIAPTTSGVSATTDASGEQVDVQETALNGAQIDSLLSIASQLGQGLVPSEGARELMKAAFPGMDRQRIDRIISAFSRFTPKPGPAVPATTPMRLQTEPATDTDPTDPTDPPADLGTWEDHYSRLREQVAAKRTEIAAALANRGAPDRGRL
jgi:hypothetical protein